MLLLDIVFRFLSISIHRARHTREIMLSALVPTLPIPFSLQLSKSLNPRLIFFNQTSYVTMQHVAYEQVLNSI